jgi:hypothetical protein
MAVRFNLPPGHKRLSALDLVIPVSILVVSRPLCVRVNHLHISHLPLAVLVTFLHDLVNHYEQVFRDCLNSHHQCLCRLPLLCSI